MSSPVSRIIERNAETYTKLAKAFEALDWPAVKAAEANTEFKEVGVFPVSLMIRSPSPISAMGFQSLVHRSRTFATIEPSRRGRCI